MDSLLFYFSAFYFFSRGDFSSWKIGGRIVMAGIERIYLEMWGSGVVLFLAIELISRVSTASLKKLAKNIWDNFLWFIEDHEECPKCGCQEHTVEVCPGPHYLLGLDSSFIPIPKKRCKKCGVIY
ncbi:MAG TPA: hypothetical protein ENJ27_01210 [Candidatus Moranbacteria bacterium]|nr:hypothetical protein [Candidatus Moranbacteria bacterium]